MVDECLKEAVDCLRSRIGEARRLAVILGSGLGSFAENLPGETVPFKAIPHWPVTSVPGHRGRLIHGILEGFPLILVQGRAHVYEGYSAQEVAFPVRVLAGLGIEVLILTNAAGSLNPMIRPGDIMLIEDHINLMSDNPLIGSSPEQTRIRFPDMSNVYDPEFIELAKEASQETGIPLRQGILLATSGPNYETPAEVRMMRILGGDAVCMSTVPEAIVASQLGLRVLGLSCITNAAAGMEGSRLSHEDVEKKAVLMSAVFNRLLRVIIRKICLELEIPNQS